MEGAESGGQAAELKEPWPLRYAGLIIGVGVTLTAFVLVMGLFVLPGPWGSDRISLPTTTSTATNTTTTTTAPTTTDPAAPSTTGTTTPPTTVTSAAASTTAPAGPSNQDVIALAKAQTDAENAVRDLGVRVAAGVGAIAAALIAWGRVELSRREDRRAFEMLRRDVERDLNERERQAREEKAQAERHFEERAFLARQHEDDRFTKAIEQLGSERLDVRLGGIYALEALLRPEEAHYRGVAIEVLCAFVSEHAEGFELEMSSTRLPVHAPAGKDRP